ncbi:MAG: tyrosine-type recombinase/integrase [Phycisphaerae bacterium]
MGEPTFMTLKEFTHDSLERTGGQIRESTLREYDGAMQDLIRVIGNADYQKVTLRDAEFYRQSCLDGGNSRATVAKKLRHIKCVFETAVKRRQLDENPLEHIKMPKYTANEIRRYSNRECERVVKAAHYLIQKRNKRTSLKWDLLILVALSTALRRGELLNCTWRDIDFEEQTIEVSPKADTAETWEWQIKDTDRRTLPLTDELSQLLVDHHGGQPEGYPYVFVPPAIYDHIQQELRAKGK